MPPSRTVTVTIGCPSGRVYDFVSSPENLPRWAAGLGTSVSQVEGRWVVQTSSGPLGIRFVDRNALGVLDHYVTLESGEEILVPMRVVANGTGSEVMVTVFGLPGTSAQQFAEDVTLVERDLKTLKRTLEERGSDG
ncbi:MAG TPA: SRPBCC family protein [Candidatus Limnocylindria bacterium]|nr:SRPBCC family protein [Candidatus Limnocylindria bacterium]